MNPDKPQYRIVTDRITRDSDGRIIVTDWHGKRHAYRDLDRALTYAASLYQSKPKSIPAAKRGKPARWTNPPQSIVWHYERHQFTAGAAVMNRPRG